jgi:hypothetical protein
MGNLQWCEVFNKAEPMYPEAAIKVSFPQYVAAMLKSLTRLALYSASTSAPNSEAMSRGVLSDPSLIGSTFVQIDTLNLNKKTSNEKRGIMFHE